MVIDAREPKVLEGPGAKGFEESLPRGVDIDLAAGDLFEQLLQLFV